MKRAVCCWLVASVGLLLWTGCGKEGGENLPATVEASGVVTLDGNPIEGASIVLTPVPPGECPAFASSDRSGNFSLKAFEAKSGAVPGSYKVQVSKTVFVEGGKGDSGFDPGEDAEHASSADAGGDWQNSLPQKYASPETSEITVEIPEGGTSDIELKLATGE